MIFVQDIQREVAREYGLPLAKLREPSPKGHLGINTYDISRPRQVAICLATRLTDHSLTRIGHFFGGRDRKTVYHAYKSVERRLKTDDDLRNTLRRVTLQLARR